GLSTRSAPGPTSWSTTAGVVRTPVGKSRRSTAVSPLRRRSAGFALPLVLAPPMLELFGQPRARPQLDVDRLPDAYDEAREPDDYQADHEEYRARRGIRELGLHTDELANPAARTRHAVEEKRDASHDAGEPEDQPGKGIDQLQG